MRKGKLLNRVLGIFFIAIIPPILTVTMIIPSYYEGVIEGQMQVLTDSVMVQLNSSLDAYVEELDNLLMIPYVNPTVFDAMQVIKDYTQHTKPADRAYIEAKNNLFEHLTKAINYSRKDIMGTTIFFGEGDGYSIYEDGSQFIPGYNYMHEPWYQEALQANGERVYIPSHKLEYLNRSDKVCVFSVAKLIKDFDTGKQVGVLKIDVHSNRIANILGQIDLHVDSIVTVWDGDHMLYSSYPEVQALDRAVLNEQGYYMLDGNYYRMMEVEVGETGLNLKVMISETEYMESITKSQAAIIFFYLISITLAYALYVALVRQVTHPITVLVDKMKAVREGNFDVRFQVKGTDEINELGENFNTMVDQLGDLIDREYKSVAMMEQARYRALQSQIEPHFLYNTLNTLIGVNRMGDKEGVEELVVNMSSLFRYIMRQKEWVRLEEEYDVICQYCSIQKIRLQDRLTYDISMSEDAKHYFIPKLLLQPLVENAVVHGIEEMGGKGSVVVRGELRDEKLHITIEDTGCGFDTELLETTDSIGLKNVLNRMTLLGAEAFYSLESEVGKGTRITLILPLKETIEC